MKHAETSKADLLFGFPVDSTTTKDIPITLIYCNQRIRCKDGVDRLRMWAKELGVPEDCITFYHAKVGAKRKRELEELLRQGKILVMICTDAVGMVSVHYIHYI
ncbi:hypothetical protein FIBSPDRAFT_754868 [Athelia psychrophila]|uniref:Uncharacterized protein n=1 Tax=Athelia psychrophila TaxID=1759441 RepID=A0A167WUW1_9AGAM|nr:hypothetical protein FIBSPDRAFT_764312 [Fibularhizoctonia sp. CBS 109695]KZP12468.1 hypothetical protein FIBSPDRAFT_754868 [Fibularhizoctonia sp. CBS 109695]